MQLKLKKKKGLKKETNLKKKTLKFCILKPISRLLGI